MCITRSRFLGLLENRIVGEKLIYIDTAKINPRPSLCKINPSSILLSVVPLRWTMTRHNATERNTFVDTLPYSQITHQKAHRYLAKGFGPELLNILRLLRLKRTHYDADE